MKIIRLTNDGCGKMDVDMGEAGFYTFVTRYNYTAGCWTLDIIDSAGAMLLAGLMLVPEVNILHAHPNIVEIIGALYLVENKIGQYLLPDSLGVTTYLIWYAPEELIGTL